MKKLSGQPSKRVSESHSSSENDKIMKLQEKLNTMQSDIVELKNSLHTITQDANAKEDEKGNNFPEEEAQENGWQIIFTTIVVVITAGIISSFLFS